MSRASFGIYSGYNVKKCELSLLSLRQSKGPLLLLTEFLGSQVFACEASFMFQKET